MVMAVYLEIYTNVNKECIINEITIYLINHNDRLFTLHDYAYLPTYIQEGMYTVGERVLYIIPSHPLCTYPPV